MMRFVLSHPTAYHYLRQVMTLGMPFKAWVPMYGLDRPDARVADIGCGPADILRYVRRDRLPALYLGLDLSESYLRSARRRAAGIGLNAELLHVDLSRIPTDESVRATVSELLLSRRIDTALLLGVMHHLDDASVQRTLDLVYEAGVSTLVTSDVIRIPGHRVNNFFCRHDRGQHVRSEAEYISILRRTAWPRFARRYTSPGLSFIQYVHYTLSR